MAKALKYICFSLLVLLLGIPALAQNTKGDRPAPQNRETRFKTPKKSKTKTRPARQIRRQDDKPSRRAGAPPRQTRTREGDRAGKPVRPLFSKSRPQQTQKAWKGDITGRRIRPRSSSSRAWNVYPQPPQINYSSRNLKRSLRRNDNPNVRRVQRMQRQDSRPRVGKPIRPTFHKSRPQQSERAWRGDITGRPIRAGRTENVRPPSPIGGPQMRPGQRTPGRGAGIVPPRVSGRARNIFTRRGFYVNNQSRRPSRGWGNVQPAATYPRQHSRARGGKIIPRSASASFLSRRSTNTWAHFKKPGRKKLAADRDLAGHRLRGKNYETPRPILSNPTWRYQKRVATGERPYKGPAAGGHVSRTRTGRAWRGDVARRAIRGGKSPRGSDRAFLGFLKGGGFRSASVPGEKRPGGALRGRAPGMGAKGIGNWKGNIRSGRRGFNDQGEEYRGNIRAGRRGFGDQGEEYTGNIRSHRLLKGGGSVSGRVWNNKGLPIQGRAPGKGNKGIGYSGNIRVGKRGFNNQGEEYTGNIRQNRRRGFSDQGEEYTGNIRTNGRRGFNDQGEEYTGNIKARRPDKGGGSRSGHWNNNNTPIQGRTPKGASARIAGYQGNIRVGRKGFQDQGEEYAGNIKARRPDKGGGSVSGKLWNNDERPLPGKDYSYAKNVSRYSGNMKAKKPGTLSADNKKAANFSGDARMARGRYARNPNSADDALPVEKASAANLRAGRSVRGVTRSWDYVKNPSSADEAQRTREPGRAFARSADYQGNLKVKRFDLFGKSDLHPDAKFVKQNKNNVPEEKDMLTNFKLWWARLFRKSETQPDHLKEKEGKPRYDKGEAGLWYE